MARKMASFRLDVELLDWAKSYAESRGTTQATVIEAGLRSLREDSEGGVPDLPTSATPIPAWKAPLGDALAAGRAEYARNISARQAKLNDAKVRASR